MKALTLPVNPAYDFSLDPEDQLPYANPVALNNSLVYLANSMASIAERLSSAMARVAELKGLIQVETQHMDQLSRALLVAEPLSASESKSLKTIEAAVQSRAKANGVGDTLDELRERVVQLEVQLHDAETKVARYRLYWETADRLSRNVTNHLSYVKDERRQSGFGV